MSNKFETLDEKTQVSIIEFLIRGPDSIHKFGSNNTQSIVLCKNGFEIHNIYEGNEIFLRKLLRIGFRLSSEKLRKKMIDKLDNSILYFPSERARNIHQYFDTKEIIHIDVRQKDKSMTIDDLCNAYPLIRVEKIGNDKNGSKMYKITKIYSHIYKNLTQMQLRDLVIPYFI